LRLLAIDIGAESGRAVVGAFDGDRLSVEEAHRFANVPVRLGGTLHWDVLRIFGDVVDGIRKAGEVTSVGIDTWGVDFGLLDRQGRLLSNPVHYRDARTAGVMRQVLQRVPKEEIYAATGIQFMEINTLYQLVAAGADLERAERLLLMPDLLNHFLCGSSSGEFTNATTTQCFDPRRRQWAGELLARLGIPVRILPEVVAPGTVLGELLPEVAEQVGQHHLPVVAPGTHDTASAVAAMPLSADGTTAFLSSGTWSLIGLELPEPLIDQASLEANVTNEGGVAGTTRLLKNVMGLWLVQQARQAFAQYGGQAAPSYESLTALAEHAPGGTAFIDPDAERFLRTTNLPRDVAAFCQETGQPVPADEGTLIRVLLESLALKYALVLEQLARLTGRQVRTLYVAGGGARNELLCQLTADATGRPVHAGAAEATAIGNLIVQALALGEVSSLAEGRELVRNSFPVRCFEPHGDWSAARERFSSLLDRGVISR
jgi:rhamnulokinase